MKKCFLDNTCTIRYVTCSNLQSPNRLHGDQLASVMGKTLLQHVNIWNEAFRICCKIIHIHPFVRSASIEETRFSRNSDASEILENHEELYPWYNLYLVTKSITWQCVIKLFKIPNHQCQFQTFSNGKLSIPWKVFLSCHWPLSDLVVGYFILVYNHKENATLTLNTAYDSKRQARLYHTPQTIDSFWL